jgi:hypothetical protein
LISQSSRNLASTLKNSKQHPYQNATMSRKMIDTWMKTEIDKMEEAK